MQMCCRSSSSSSSRILLRSSAAVNLLHRSNNHHHARIQHAYHGIITITTTSFFLFVVLRSKNTSCTHYRTVRCSDQDHLPSLLHAMVRSVSLLLTTPAYQMSLVLTSAGIDGCILHAWLVFNQACSAVGTTSKNNAFKDHWQGAAGLLRSFTDPFTVSSATTLTYFWVAVKFTVGVSGSNPKQAVAAK